MAGIKRKTAIAFKSENDNVQKKSRKDEKPVKRSKTEIAALETATDSDPIVESDTTSQSGEDNGVDWPSEDDEEPDESVGVDEDSDDGGVKVVEGTANTHSTGPATNGVTNGI